MGYRVNDIHSQLNATTVHEVVPIHSEQDVIGALQRARAGGLRISVAGGRHSMGGQQFGKGSLHLDMRPFNRVLGFDAQARTITVQPGIMWPELVAALEALQGGEVGPILSFRQKQTGGDRFSIGGSVSSNIHGRGLDLAPFVEDVEAIRLLRTDGTIVEVSRSHEAELFSLVCGGYGLFGIMLSVTLRLFPRFDVRRRVRIATVDDLMEGFAERRREGCRYGDFQFSCAPGSDDFLHRGVFACYEDIGPSHGPAPEGNRVLSEGDWKSLIHLAHVDKEQAFARYAAHYLATDGQVYHSDTHQMGLYVDDYHADIDAATGCGKGSEMISELYVPPAHLPAFLAQVRDDFRCRGTDLIYGTVRLIEADTTSFLPWARHPWACVIFNLHTAHDGPSIARTAEDFRLLIDRAMGFGGSYYLTYHRWARRDQVLGCHPRIREFLAAKLRHDPDEILWSDWYQTQVELFGTSRSRRVETMPGRVFA